MFFKLILENENGDRVDMTTTANQYMTSKVEGLNPPAGTISTSSYAEMNGSYLNNAFIEKRNIVINFEMRGMLSKVHIPESVKKIGTYSFAGTSLTSVKIAPDCTYSDLADKLEKLHSVLNCSKIIINSGYRCQAHDRNVGGTGAGQHVNGTAADIVCYDSEGRVISSKIVCCAAQDIGFGGIANIDGTYTATHVDVRSFNFWKGNEVKTTAYSVTNDFYKYYGLSESDVYPASAKKSKKFTITVDGVTYSGTLTEK